MQVSIRPAIPSELAAIYALVISNDEWTKFNGPYFPYSPPSLEEFESHSFKRLLNGSDLQLVVVDDVPVGTVSVIGSVKRHVGLKPEWSFITLTIGGRVLLRQLFLFGYLAYSKTSR